MQAALITSLACILIHATNSWILEVNHNTVTPQLTTNVTISCYRGNNGINSPTITDIYRIRISKFNGVENEWDPVVTMSLRDPVVKTTFTDATVTGDVDAPTNTFIKAHFEVASEEIVGQFLCEIDGFDDHTEVVAIKPDPIIIIKNKGSYDDVLKTLIDLNKKENEDATELKALKELVHLLESRIQSSINERKQNEKATSLEITNLKRHDEKIDIRINNLDDRLSTLVNGQSEMLDLIKQLQHKDSSTTLKPVTAVKPTSIKPITTVKPITTSHPITTARHITTNYPVTKPTSSLQEWPIGHYMLLKTKTGCPDSHHYPPWEFSSIRYATHFGDDKNDSSSNELHLLGPVFQNINDTHYVYLQYCAVYFWRPNTGPMWPNGSYCINKYQQCPPGFQDGVVHYSRYRDGGTDLTVNIGGSVHNTYYMDTSYCCRADGDPSDPITLPLGDSFYLYRLNGTCQQVSGMTVTNEWIHLVGESQYPSEYRYNNNNLYPDGFANKDGVRLELCYYTPNL